MAAGEGDVGGGRAERGKALGQGVVAPRGEAGDGRGRLHIDVQRRPEAAGRSQVRPARAHDIQHSIAPPQVTAQLPDLVAGAVGVGPRNDAARHLRQPPGLIQVGPAHLERLIGKRVLEPGAEVVGRPEGRQVEQHQRLFFLGKYRRAHDRGTSQYQERQIARCATTRTHLHHSQARRSLPCPTQERRCRGPIPHSPSLRQLHRLAGVK